MKTVNILGTEYTITVDNELFRQNCDGLVKLYEKTIKIKPWNDILQADDKDCDKMYRQKEVMRHEIIHAFFTESGLCEYCDNEQLIDWIAMQFPKMQKVFAELGAL